jgi:hypothetical protein
MKPSSLILPLLCSAFAIYQFTRPGAASTTQWIFGVSALVFIGLSVFLYAFTNLFDLEKLQKNNDRISSLYGVAHVRTVVDETEIAARGLDLGFYQQTRTELESLGFRFLADYIDETMDEATRSVRSVLRVMVSEDGGTHAAAYHARFFGLFRLMQLIRVAGRHPRCMDLETELSDGTWVTTSNATDAAMALETPGISRRFTAGGAAATAVHQLHVEHLREVLASKGAGVEALRCHTLEEVFAAQDRSQQLKHAFRQSAAYDPVAEAEKIAGKPLTEAQRAYYASQRRPTPSIPPPLPNAAREGHP